MVMSGSRYAKFEAASKTQVHRIRPLGITVLLGLVILVRSDGFDWNWSSDLGDCLGCKEMDSI